MFTKNLKMSESLRLQMEVSSMELTLVAIVVALGLIGVVAIDIVTFDQDAEAKGCSSNSQAVNASEGRCIRF